MKLFSIILLFVSNSLFAQPIIKGTIYGGENCLGKVKITLELNGKTYRLKSNNKGNFKLSNINSGVYKIGFEKKGFVGFTIDNFEITPDSNLNLTVQLFKVRSVHDGGMISPPKIKIDTLSQTGRNLLL